MPRKKKIVASNAGAKAAPKAGGKRKGVDAAKADIPIKKERKEVKDEPGTSKAEDPAQIKKIKFCGSVPMDDHCPLAQSGYHVYVDPHNGWIYNAMLNQTNVGLNNNKYYILQLLKHNARAEYVTWFRWGRVGKIAGNTLRSFAGDEQMAKNEFESKFSDKSGNHWVFRSCFTKKKGKYDMVDVDYGDTDEVKQEVTKIRKKTEGMKYDESKLDERVGGVMDLIFDLKEFEAVMKEMQFDTRKAPLGKLKTSQIKAGYESLKKIEQCIKKKDFGEDLTEACSEFYTRIPHDFGMKRPPLIKTTDELKTKIELLEALSDIQIAIEVINDDDKQEKVNPKDAHYGSLGCKLEPFNRKDEDFKMVDKFIKVTHGSTHRQYKIYVENVFRIQRESDEKRFKSNIGNRMLLWHGSRLTNWCGILKQGLRIAPPEAPSTGYMFGKGVYFADVFSKSANYCWASQRQPMAFLLLCEVALGNTSDKTRADYNANKLPKGKHSTKGVGRETPNPAGFKKLECGTIVPMGKPKNVGGDTWLQYNEFIVYDVAQIKPRYLVQVKFQF